MLITAMNMKKLEKRQMKKAYIFDTNSGERPGVSQ